jgi:hypothetical protein
MEPLTAGAIAIGTIIATKALEKTTEKGTDILLGKAGEFLVTLNKHSPKTVVAIEKAQQQRSCYQPPCKAEKSYGERISEKFVTNAFSRFSLNLKIITG